MQQVFDWMSSFFFWRSRFERVVLALLSSLTLFLLLVGSTFALPVLSSSSAEVPFSGSDLNQVGFTIQSTDTLDTAYPLAPDDAPAVVGGSERNGREAPQGVEPPAGYVPPDEPATTSDSSQTDCTLEAEFVDDSAALNELRLSPGETFSGVWQVRNIGTCVWDDSYSVESVQNNPIELVPVSINIGPVLPGDEFEVRLFLLAPSTIGPYSGAWQLQGPNLELFGPLLRAQVLVIEEGVLEEEAASETPTTDTQAITGTPLPLTDTQAITGTPLPLTDTQAITGTVAVPTERATQVPTATQLPTATPTQPATATRTEQPTETPLPLPSPSPSPSLTATSAPIEVPTNTPTVVMTPTSTIAVAASGSDEGGITSFLASLPGPLQNPMVLALVISIPILLLVLLLLIWRLLRQSGPPVPPARASVDPPNDDPPSDSSISFRRPVDQSLSEERSFDQANRSFAPPTASPVAVAQQALEAPTVKTDGPPPAPVKPVDRSFAPWDSESSPFAPRPATVTPVRPTAPASARFRPAVVKPPSTAASGLSSKPMAPLWSDEPIDSMAFATEPPPTGTPYLKSLGRPQGVVYFPLTKRMIKVGRGADNDLIINESFIGWQTVSRRHAEIERDGEDIFVFDLGTTNGVRINGQQSGNNLLQQDCTISFGQLQFAFRMNRG